MDEPDHQQISDLEAAERNARLGPEEGIHASTDPDDLASSDMGPGLTAGGTGTEIGSGLIPEGGTQARDEADARAAPAPNPNIGRTE